MTRLAGHPSGASEDPAPIPPYWSRRAGAVTRSAKASHQRSRLGDPRDGEQYPPSVGYGQNPAGYGQGLGYGPPPAAPRNGFGIAALVLGLRALVLS
jgi:hypothetical protein